MVHLGTRAFEEMGGEVISTTSFILKNGIFDLDSIFVRLVDEKDADLKEKIFRIRLLYFKTKKI